MNSPRSESSAESRTKLPPNIAKLNKEELQRTVQSLLRRLKQRDGQIKEFESRLASVSETGTEDIAGLQQEKEILLREKTSLEESLTESGAQLASAQQHVQDVSNQLQELSLALKSKDEEKNSLGLNLTQLRDQHEALLEQVSSLKTAVQSSMEERDIAVSLLSEEKERSRQLEDALAAAQERFRKQVDEQTTPDLNSEDKNQLKTIEANFQTVKQSLEDQLAQSEERRNGLEKELAATEDKLKEEARNGGRMRQQLEMDREEKQSEINQLKQALMRVTGQLEEASQEQRITSQRLNDEQETSNQLRKEIQDLMGKLQTSELEMWKKMEALTKEKTDLEEKLNLLVEEKQEELKKAQGMLESHQEQQNSHQEEIAKIKQLAENEKEKLKKAIGELRRRLDKASSQIKESEVEKTKLVEDHFSEKEKLQAELQSLEKNIEKLNIELKSYKAKAHLLVKSKDEEIEKLVSELQQQTDLAVELKVLKEKYDDIKVERDNINEELTQANERFQIHLDDLVGDFQTQLNDKTIQLDNLEETCENHVHSIQQWTEKHQHLEQLLQEERAKQEKKAIVEVKPCEDCVRLQGELEKIKSEFSGYRKTMERKTEVQQIEMNRLIQTNLDSRLNHAVEKAVVTTSEAEIESIEEILPQDSFHFEDLMTTTTTLKSEDGLLHDENQIVALASRQAEREETFQTLRKQNDQLITEVEELEKEIQLHKEQETVLKNALRAADELKKANMGPPKNMDYQYLKNTVMKLITTGESETLLPVFAKLLNFTEDEVETLMSGIKEMNKKKTEELSTTGSLFSTLTDWTTWS